MFFLLLATGFVWFGNNAAILLENDRPSVSHGTPANGRIENAKRLPTCGKNFSAYSRLGTAIGRNAGHSAVRDTIVDAYEELCEKFPDKVFVYGETGWPWGGRFRPHKTHQNGLSADFFVPVLTKNGQSVPLATHVLNKWGYSVEFDKYGKLGELAIDFKALAAHIYFLRVAGKRHGVKIGVVIFTPEYQPMVLKTRYGKKLRGKVRFSKNPSWVRHDEHYHITFELLPQTS